VAIAVLALPQIRDRHHNLFENAHRLGGWSCILVFWPILVLFVRSEASSSEGVTLAHALVHSAAFWLLLVISVHVIYPWIMLRKVPVIKVEHLSDRAVRLYSLRKNQYDLSMECQSPTRRCTSGTASPLFPTQAVQTEELLLVLCQRLATGQQGLSTSQLTFITCVAAT
jgi:hypothetical protein